VRKRFKVKRHSCPICKPHKMRWAKRWKRKELSGLEESEKAILSAVKERD